MPTGTDKSGKYSPKFQTKVVSGRAEELKRSVFDQENVARGRTFSKMPVMPEED